MHAFALLKVCAERCGTQTRKEVMRGSVNSYRMVRESGLSGLHGRSALVPGTNEDSSGRLIQQTLGYNHAALKTQTKRPGSTVVI